VFSVVKKAVNKTDDLFYLSVGQDQRASAMADQGRASSRPSAAQDQRSRILGA
jgi:hypothetical protein